MVAQNGVDGQPKSALISAHMSVQYRLAKSMVSLASKSVLSEYWSSGSGEHTSGKLRVRGVRIRGVPGKVSNHCEVNM